MDDLYDSNGRMNERYKGTLAYAYAEAGVAWREFMAALAAVSKPRLSALLAWLSNRVRYW